MGWKSKLHTLNPKGEEVLFRMLSKAGLTKRMLTQQTIVLWKTVPDFMWNNHVTRVLFLDGEEVHSGEQTEKDERIDAELERRNIQVLRVRYKPPLIEGSKQALEIVGKVREFVGETEIE